jgi:aryl-alcohol dehydrogenase-like predicted oxidoreductase
MQALSAGELTNRYWMLGWSNWEADRINQSIKLSSKYLELPKPVINSAYFSLFEMSERTIHAGGVQVTHQEMNNPEFEKGINQMSYSPLGGFSIFDKPEPIWENAKKSAKEKYDQGDAYWQNVYPAIFTDANQARYNRVVEFTKKFNQDHGTNYTIDQMINAYALAHKRSDFLAVGPITVEQLRRTVASLKLSKMLTDADLNYLHSGN